MSCPQKSVPLSDMVSSSAWVGSEAFGGSYQVSGLVAECPPANW